MPLAYKEGFSEKSRQVLPNQGIIQKSNRYGSGISVFFDQLALNHLTEDIYTLDEGSIFAMQDYLVKPGVMVRKKFIEQRSGDFCFRQQEFFEVFQSSCQIQKGSAVICMPNTAIKFCMDDNELFYIAKDHIYVEINKEKGLLPGYGKILVRPSFTKPGDYSSAPGYSQNKGTYQGKAILFKNHLSRINWAGQDYYVVDSEDVYGEVTA